MVEKKRVYVYIDGSNFYHHLKENYQSITSNFSHFYELSVLMSEPNSEVIKLINYYNAPLSQQDNPLGYARQNKFFANLRANPLIKIHLGSLRKRSLKELTIKCLNCGIKKANIVKCPDCKTEIDITTCYRYSEKGVDVNLAISMLLDAIDNKFDTAFLFSSDADFVPAIHHITKKLKKDIIYCHFPRPRTDALRNACTESRLIELDLIEKADPAYSSFSVN